MQLHARVMVEVQALRCVHACAAWNWKVLRLVLVVAESDLAWRATAGGPVLVECSALVRCMHEKIPSVPTLLGVSMLPLNNTILNVCEKF